MVEVDEAILDKLSEAFYLLLRGRPAAPVELPPEYPENELRQLVGYINRFLAEYGDLSGCMIKRFWEILPVPAGQRLFRQENHLNIKSICATYMICRQTKNTVWILPETLLIGTPMPVDLSLSEI